MPDFGPIEATFGRDRIHQWFLYGLTVFSFGFGILLKFELPDPIGGLLASLSAFAISLFCLITALVRFGIRLDLHRDGLIFFRRNRPVTTIPYMEIAKVEPIVQRGEFCGMIVTRRDGANVRMSGYVDPVTAYQRIVGKLR